MREDNKDGTAVPAVPGVGRAKALWGKLDSGRMAQLERARTCAALTIPQLLPPLGYNGTMPLPTPYQSVGARGVNNLASKLMLALFPPGTSFFKLAVDEDVGERLGASLSDVEDRLAAIERKAATRFDASALRPNLFEALCHLVVTGNILMRFTGMKDMAVYRFDQYVIERDQSGNLLGLVAKETVSAETLDEAVRAACQITDDKRDVDVFTRVEFEDGRVLSRQEINGYTVPGSEGDLPADKSEWLVLRWRAVPNNPYGRGLVEEYLGDLRSCEGLNEGIVKFSAAAAKIVMLVHPNATTSVKDINKAESGDAIVGTKADIDVLQLEKYADFQVASSVLERIERRLAQAFLLGSNLTRNAERVTAEEIRAIAQELEDTLGGVYTLMAQELQLPLTQRLLAVLAQERAIPRLPRGTVMPTPITGFQALGRSHALNKLRAFVADVSGILGPETAQQYLKPDQVITRIGTGYGIEKLSDLTRTEDEVQQAVQVQQQRELAAAAVKGAAGPVAGALVKPQ